MRLMKFLGALGFGVFLMSNAQAALNIEITGGINEGRKIAVLPFAQSANVGVDVASVVSADLMRSGKFSPILQNQIPAGAFDGEKVNTDVMAGTGAEAVVFGKVYPDGNSYQVEFLLQSLVGEDKGQIIAHYRGASGLNTMRQAAHRVSDRVYEKLVGQKGAFRTRIAYVVFRHGTKFPYQLMTADYDGFNEVPILKSTEPIMTPSWSPDGTKIVYVSFENKNPAIFIQDLNTKQRTRIANFKGLNSSPAWSPDGSKIAMVLSKDGQPDIYYYDVNTRAIQRVTADPAIDTEPNWSADGRQLFFTSERGGRAQIYKFDFNTRTTERLTYQGQMNLSAEPIPGTNSVIMITRHNGYRVARMDEDGSIYMLTTSNLDESPSVAPNGSMVIYSTIYQGRKGLAIVSADGRFRANLPSTSGEISSPAWGPLLDK
nr:Tol-Pal system beta propeller repeat protein TolB [uncultured Succinatimonas sp.]